MATPATVATLAARMAFPLEEHVEAKVTLCGEVTGTPPLDTVAETLVVPNAESAETPVTGAVIVIGAIPTEKPSEPVTGTSVCKSPPPADT